MNCETVLQLLLTGSRLVSFEFWNDFVLRIERADSTPSGTEDFAARPIPQFFGLRLRGPWWVNNVQEWRQQLAAFPVQVAEGIPSDAALQAAMLMHLIGVTIEKTVLKEPGTLLLHCDNGDVIRIAGTGTEEEECWLLESAPQDDQDEPWYILCDRNGDLFGKWPEGA